MVADPTQDPAEVLAQVQTYWDDNAHLVEEINQQQITEFAYDG